jgi:hypothetical protein
MIATQTQLSSQVRLFIFVPYRWFAHFSTCDFTEKIVDTSPVKENILKRVREISQEPPTPTVVSTSLTCKGLF